MYAHWNGFEVEGDLVEGDIPGRISPGVPDGVENIRIVGIYDEQLAFSFVAQAFDGDLACELMKQHGLSCDDA